MISLNSVISEMKALEPDSKMDLEIVNPKVRVGMEGRKRAAQVRLEELSSQYAKAVWDNAVFVVPINARRPEHVEEFAATADAIGEFMPVSYTAWDKHMGASWWAANGKKPQNLETVHNIQLFDALRKMMAALKLPELATPPVPRQVPLNSEQQCVDTVKKITTDGCGIDFRLALLQNEVAETARKFDWIGRDNQPVPFVLTDATEEDVVALETLAPNKFYTVDLSNLKLDDIEEFTKKTLEKVVKSHKKSK